MLNKIYMFSRLLFYFILEETWPFLKKSHQKLQIQVIKYIIFDLLINNSVTNDMNNLYNILDLVVNQ